MRPLPISAALRTVLVVLAVAAAALAALFAPAALGGAPAHAHTSLEDSAPADGEQLAAAPEAVTLTFTEAVLSDFLQLAVTGPDGAPVAAGPATVDGPVVRQPISLTASGAHVVAYRVVSADGHPVTGQLTFTLTAADDGASASRPAAASPPASPSAADSPAASAAADEGFLARWWPMLALGAALIAVAVLPWLALLWWSDRR